MRGRNVLHSKKQRLEFIWIVDSFFIGSFCGELLSRNMGSKVQWNRISSASICLTSPENHCVYRIFARVLESSVYSNVPSVFNWDHLTWNSEILGAILKWHRKHVLREGRWVSNQFSSIHKKYIEIVLYFKGDEIFWGKINKNADSKMWFGFYSSTTLL